MRHMTVSHPRQIQSFPSDCGGQHVLNSLDLFYVKFLTSLCISSRLLVFPSYWNNSHSYFCNNEFIYWNFLLGFVFFLYQQPVENSGKQNGIRRCLSCISHTSFHCRTVCYLSVGVLHVKGTHCLNCSIAVCVARHTLQHKCLCQIVRRLLCWCHFINWCMSVCECVRVGKDYFHMCPDRLGMKWRNS